MKTLQVGKSYRDGCRYEYHITENTKSDRVLYPFKGTHTRTGDVRTYTHNGIHIKSAPSIVDDLVIPCETEAQQKEPTMKHLEVILAIVQGTPVQYDSTLTGTWHDYGTEGSTEINPVNYPEYNWRIKHQPAPKRTVVIGKRTVVAPEVEAPASGSEYWIPHESYTYIWNNDSIDQEYLEAGRIFLDKYDAKMCSDALTHILLGKDGI
jgi:hypothetical protein